MTELATYLRRGASTPFVWGSCDCCTWACGWIAERRGADPAKPYRGRYRTAIGAARQYARTGGLEATVRAAMATSGLSETKELKAGDVGLINMSPNPVLAIKTETGWAAKTMRGIVVAPFSYIVAWAI